MVPERDAKSLPAIGESLADRIDESLATRTGLRPGASPEQDAVLWTELLQADFLRKLLSTDLKQDAARLDAVYETLASAGAGLLSLPILSSTLAAACLEAAQPSHGPLLARVYDGTARCAVACIGAGAGAEGVRAEAISGDTWRVNGEVSFVLDGMEADFVIIPAETISGTTLFLVDAGDTGLHRETMETFDLTLPQAHIKLVEATAEPVGDIGAGAALLGSLASLAKLVLSIQHLGGMEVCLRLSTQRAQNRRQFGLPIGAFQAVKHKCVDMYVAVETTRAMVRRLLELYGSGDPQFKLAALEAACYSLPKYRAAAENCIQIHGGHGVTWAHPGHLHLRRAISSAGLLGSAREMREVLLVDQGI